MNANPITGYGVEVNELLDSFKNSSKKIFRDFYQGFLDYKDHLQNTDDDQGFDDLESSRIDNLIPDVVVTRPCNIDNYYILISEISPIIDENAKSWNNFRLYTRAQANQVIFQAFSKVWLDGYPFKNKNEQSKITDELKKQINELAGDVMDVDYC